MDPQNQLSGLDPKLKEAYERVMGTTIPPASPPPAPPQEPAISAPTPPTEPASIPSNEPPKEPVSPSPVNEPPPSANEPPSLPPQPEPPPIPPPEQPPVTQSKTASSPVQPTGFVANAAKKGKPGGLKISPPILMAVGAAFLLLYIFFWMRVFNLSFPF